MFALLVDQRIRAGLERGLRRTHELRNRSGSAANTTRVELALRMLARPEHRADPALAPRQGPRGASAGARPAPRRLAAAGWADDGQDDEPRDARPSPRPAARGREERASAMSKLARPLKGGSSATGRSSYSASSTPRSRTRWRSITVPTTLASAVRRPTRSRAARSSRSPQTPGGFALGSSDRQQRRRTSARRPRWPRPSRPGPRGGLFEVEGSTMARTPSRSRGPLSAGDGAREARAGAHRGRLHARDEHHVRTGRNAPSAPRVRVRAGPGVRPACPGQVCLRQAARDRRSGKALRSALGPVRSCRASS